ncbi:MAG: glycosyltransferase [Candidatus Omnitrophota bacterium]
MDSKQIAKVSLDKKVWRGLERRKFERYNFDAKVKISGQRSCFIAHNLSLGGIAVSANKFINLPKDRIHLKFFPPKKFIDDIFDSECKIYGNVVRKELKDEKISLGIKFEKDLALRVKDIYKQRISRALIFLFIILNGILFLKLLNIRFYWYRPIINIYSLAVTTYILSRFLIALFYKPPKDTGFLPVVSFVIPVRNEENLIANTIHNCYLSDYPKTSFEVIVVNDHSCDNTLNILNSLKYDYPSLKIIDLKNKSGKRQAMAAGIREARGDIITMLDSDSLIRKDALYYLMQGFRDQNVAAISGQAYVLNAEDNILTKMQEVRYFVAFRVIKAAESVFSAVSCCSGSLSAYRKVYLMDVMDKWLNQKFLGTAATFGDDRSLTNFLLRKHRILFDSRAVTETLAPDKWRKFFNQQLRWKKSWFRESLIAARFIWEKHIIASISFYVGIILPLISPLIVFNAFILKPLVYRQLPFYYATGIGLVAFFYCFYYFLKRPNSKWIYGIYFCLLYVCTLSWQTYYAIFTSRRNHWGTR